jgi:threonine/homoserine/homoserine lactone efflux protein
LIVFILKGLVLGATAAAQPGPFQAFLLSLIARGGWRRALPAAFAPLLSDGPILLIVFLALARLPEWLLAGLQIAGGFFLLYLAWGAWRVFRRGAAAEAGTAPTMRGDAKADVAQAALMNFLSPSPYIFWATVAGPILLDAWRQTPLFGVAFLLSFYIALVGGLMLFILIFAGAGNLHPRANRALSALSAVGLFAFGLYQLVTGVGGVATALGGGFTN